jgi:hypothetical protein
MDPFLWTVARGNSSPVGLLSRRSGAQSRSLGAGRIDAEKLQDAAYQGRSEKGGVWVKWKLDSDDR